MSDLNCPSVIKTVESEVSDYPDDIGELNNLRRCQGICGPNHYIELDTSGPPGIPPTSECKSCEDIDENSEFIEQCFSNNPNNWFETQKSMNVGLSSDTVLRKDWSKANLVTNDECSNLGGDDILADGTSEMDKIIGCEILSYYENTDLPMSDYDLLKMFGIRSGTNSDGSINYIPDPEYESLDDLRNKIHENKGSQVAINLEIIQKWRDNLLEYLDKNEQPPPGYGLEDLTDTQSGNYTEKHIIFQEAYEFKIEQYGDGRTNIDGGVRSYDIGSLFSTTASNSEFELCMNNILDDSSKNYCGGEDHLKIMEDITSVTNILNLKPCHIDYIEDKLKRISIVDLSDAHKCMNILNISETCEQPVSTKMLQMGYLIFHIIGLDKIDLQSISEGSPQYYKLTQIIDRLTPYIKQAIKRIIEISKHYEERTCGKESTTTHVLERMYIDIFEKSKEVSIKFNAMDFIPTFLIKDTNIEEFVKTVILMVIAIAAVYVLIMVLNRPPYPTK